eukprot:gnl/Dysnectes_brevis/5986_a8963_313.p1 GENE.gnl/Dysnectes_brevis/5986_a8963_313~~gnl/Dysnectes_brevis/5986_a8963_313.p1  ORF type:complete len:369 (+),score=81.31 gnl/Dysnectes_brevis/5986_a8963_313:155-1261(+)
MKMLFVLQKLRLLEYEREYCQPKQIPPFSATYFSYPSKSPTEQLLSFAALVKWLLDQIDPDSTFAEQSEFDDPNAIATEILSAVAPHVKTQGISPHKIKTGHGPVVLSILLSLIDIILKNRGMMPCRPVWQAPPSLAVRMEESEEEAASVDDTLFEDVEALEDADAEGHRGPGLRVLSGRADTSRDREVAPGVPDLGAWHRELEALGTHRTAAPAGWRTQLKGLAELQGEMERMGPTVSPAVSRLVGEVARRLEKVARREEWLNERLGGADGLRRAEGDRRQAEGELATANTELEELTSELSAIGDRLSKLKLDLATESSRMSDVSPLKRMKDAIKKIKEDIRQLDLQICIVRQRLFARPQNTEAEGA